MRDIFRNRIEAGQLLAGKLMRYANQPNVIVLGGAGERQEVGGRGHRL